MMKGREGKAGPSADLLVCFPSRAHLSLMPKPICSPGRCSESKKRQHRLKKSSTRGGGQASPILWAKPKSMGSDIDEPTSPKVTCAGQIKVTQKPSATATATATACSNWQSVMQQIETIHNHTKHRKRSNWPHSLGFKREIMQFLTCLRTLRFDFGCFGSVPETDVTTDDEDEDDDDDEEGYQENRVDLEETDSDTSEDAFSKWFMMLQENQNNGEGSVGEPAIPPANALLLMRCRSAPAQTWLKKNEEQGNKGQAHKQEENDEKVEQSLMSLMEEDKREKENLVVMRCVYDSDFYKISTDIAKETWIVGGLRDPLCKSRSWKT